MKYDLKGQAVLLTGASSGIGRALALELAGRGARLGLVARRERLLEELADEIANLGGERPGVLVADLSVRGAAADVARRTLAALGRVDVLVNNAGGGVGGLQWNVGDRDEAREAFEVNVWSPLALTAAIVPGMLERGSGTVVNVTSLAKVMTWAGMGHYAATKAAISVATETLHIELSGSGVRVLEVLPGPVDTAVQAESRLAPGFAELTARTPMGDAGVLARLIVRALEKGRTRVIYPRVLAATYHLPGLARTVTRRHARRLGRDSSLRGNPMVVRTGSHGDPLSIEARRQWEQERPERGS